MLLLHHEGLSANKRNIADYIQGNFDAESGEEWTKRSIGQRSKVMQANCSFNLFRYHQPRRKQMPTPYNEKLLQSLESNGNKGSEVIGHVGKLQLHFPGIFSQEGNKC